MEWMLRLVGTGIDDGQSRSFDVMEISRPDGLGDLANLGLTLAEAKQLLARVQQDVAAAQADNQAMFRPDCQSCGGGCHVKDWQPHRIVTLFGEVRARLLGFCVLDAVVSRPVSVGRRNAGRPLSWINCKPGFAPMTYRVAADVLVHLLPIDAGRALRHYAAIRCGSASTSAMRRRITRQPRRQLSL
jgi:hypothetical protein